MSRTADARKLIQVLDSILLDEVDIRPYPRQDQVIARPRRRGARASDLFPIMSPGPGGEEVTFTLTQEQVLTGYCRLVLSGSASLVYLGRVQGGARTGGAFNFHAGTAERDVEQGEYVGHHLVHHDELHEVVGVVRSRNDELSRWIVERLSSNGRPTRTGTVVDPSFRLKSVTNKSIDMCVRTQVLVTLLPSK
jgi:hypothetical protein